MNKRKSTISPYAYLDSQRLWHTFFGSPAPVKKPFFKHPAFIAFLILVAISIGIAYLLSHYDILLISRNANEPLAGEVSLLQEKGHSTVTLLGPTQRPLQVAESVIYLAPTYPETTGIKIDFAKPINLRANDLFLQFKKAGSLSKIHVIFRDKHFFSNARSPLIVEAETVGHRGRVPLALTTQTMPKANLAKVNQLKLYFDFKDENYSPIVVKDLVLVKKEGM